MIISRDSKTLFAIYYAPCASESEQFAAEELMRYLNRVTGANFSLISGGDVPEYALVVGPCNALNELGINLDKENLGNEGFIIRTAGNRIIIAGGQPRGTLYGVYTFLEDLVGCRWYTPTLEKVPERPTLDIGAPDIRFVPKLEYRESFFVGHAFDGFWSARNKNNGQFARLYDFQGGKVRYYPFVHTFDALLSPAEYFDQHPEYFSMVDGQRIRERTQLCLTNPDVLTIATDRVRKWIQDHPDVTIISVSQNDWYNPCQCPECKAIDDHEGSHAGTLITFVNKIAQVIEKEYPHIVIDTLAYQYTRTPPKFVRPRPNVCVRLCTIECCFAHPLKECDHICSFGNRIRGDSFQRDLEGWAKICDRLYVWDYVVNFHHFLMPFPNLDVLAPNIRYFIENNVKGIFEEGSTSVWGRTEFIELKSWVLAQLLWNPDLDADALIREFVAAFYEQSAPHIQAYIDLLQDSLRKVPDAHFGIYDPPRVPYLTDAVVSQAKSLMEKAKEAANSSAILERVLLAELPIRYWELLTMPLDTPGRMDLIEAFREDLISRSLMQIKEGAAFEPSIQLLREGLIFRFPQS